MSWDEETDVVVVGFGAAGACAALEARASGAEVLVCDRFTGGGATAISGGVFYAGGGTHIQAEAGVRDDVEAMFQYLSLEVKDAVSPETLRRFCEQSAGHLTWLAGHGVPFEASLCPHKTSYPSDDYFLYYSGNEGFSPYREAAKPAPRGHRAKGTGLPGANFYEPLRASTLQSGARTSLYSRVAALVVEGGHVVGVELRRVEGRWARLLHRTLSRAALTVNPYHPKSAKGLRRRVARIERKAKTVRVRARRGVVLSTGGFIYDRKMVAEHAAPYRPGFPLGTPGDDGSGIRLGQSVGGATDRLDRVSAWRFLNPPEAFTRGVLVDADGRRFVDERLYGAAVGEAMVEKAGGVGWLVLDRALWKQARAQVGGGQTHWFQTAPALLNLYANAKKASTAEGLARTLGLTALPETLAAADHAFDAPPYYAIDCGIGSRRWPCPTLTLGGLVVDEGTGAVRTEAAADIPGLFAAGRAAVGVCSQQYVSGLSLADCVFSGRRAGRHAAQESP